MPDPAKHKDLHGTVVSNIVKASMVELYARHVDQCHVHLKCQKQPVQTVVVTKEFAVGKLAVSPLSRTVVLHDPKNKISNGFLVEVNGHEYAVKRDFAWPDKSQKSGTARTITEPNIVPFWLLRRSTTRSQVNCERKLTSVVCKVDKKSFVVDIPVYVNTVALKEGDELVIQKESEEPDEDVAVAEPAQKRLRGDTKGDKGSTKGGKGSTPSRVSADGKGKKGGKAGKGKGKAAKAKR